MKWSEGQNGKLGVWFADVEDIAAFRESLNKACDYLEEKYKDKPANQPIFTVLNIDKFVPPQEYLSN